MLQALTVLGILLLVQASTEEDCPTWFEQSDHGCECTAATLDLVVCEQYSNKTSVLFGYCLTFDNAYGTLSFGACPYNTYSSELYHTVPTDPTKLTQDMCGPLNRTGLLCSECQPGLGPAMFSYYRECKECIDHPWGWILFAIRVIVPMTTICTVMIVFRINLVSPALNGFVLVAQLITSEFNYNPFVINGFEKSYSIAKFVADCYGLFSLDFFTYLLPTFCASENMSMLEVVALEYVVAIIPILFIVFLYLLITLHDRGCRVLYVCWRPFHTCFARMRTSWKVKGSVINVFATFMLLSYCKFCSTSLYLLQSVAVREKSNDTIERLYYKVEYTIYSKEYQKFKLLAITVLIATVALPALSIMLYQLKTFQKIISFCHFHFFNEVANNLQGCFKNGTEPGTRDHRWFAGYYLMVRIMLICSVNSRNHYFNFIIVSSFTGFLIATLRPYKVNRYNTLDSLFWLLAVFIMTWNLHIKAYSTIWTWRYLVYILACTPLVYFFCYLLWGVITFAVRFFRQYVKKKRQTIASIQEMEGDDNVLPHRFLYPDEYSPLMKQL